MATKMLTDEEWFAIKPPFSHMTVKNKEWTKAHRGMIKAWIEAHCGGGWVYWDGQDTYVFQSPGDKIMTKMWLMSDPFSEPDGEIAAP